MKKIVFLLFAICIASVSSSFAQNKIEKYCKVTITYKRFSTKPIPVISFGNEKELFNLKDTSMFEKVRMVARLTTEPDILNYMAMLGWSLVDIHTDGWINIYFKKSFEVSEFVQGDNLKRSNINSD